MYLVFSAFTSRPISLLATTKASTFFYTMYASTQYINIISINQDNGHRYIISPGVKEPEPKVAYLPPSTANVKNEWRYTSTPLYESMTFTGTPLLLCNTADLGL
jgi:hypothetical protein